MNSDSTPKQKEKILVLLLQALLGILVLSFLIYVGWHAGAMSIITPPLLWYTIFVILIPLAIPVASFFFKDNCLIVSIILGGGYLTEAILCYLMHHHFIKLHP